MLLYLMTLFPLCLFQDHYDFGMRAVKTVISTAGNLKRENPTMNEVNVLILHTVIDLRGLFCSHIRMQVQSLKF